MRHALAGAKAVSPHREVLELWTSAGCPAFFISLDHVVTRLQCCGDVFCGVGLGDWIWLRFRFIGNLKDSFCTNLRRYSTKSSVIVSQKVFVGMYRPVHEVSQKYGAETGFHTD